jgi:hypothetical protein
MQAIGLGLPSRQAGTGSVDKQGRVRLLAPMSLSNFYGFSCATPFTGRLQCSVQTGLEFAPEHSPFQNVIQVLEY